MSIQVLLFLGFLSIISFDSNTSRYYPRFSNNSGGREFSLAQNDLSNIRIKFSPTRTGSKNASLHFENNDPDENPLKIGMGSMGPSGWPVAPFRRGLNLLEWFQEPRSGQININRYTEEDFQTIRAMGCDNVRLLIDILNQAGPAPDYELDSLFLKFLDLAVDWAEAAELFIVLDNHSWDPVIETDPAIEPVLLATWAQMARHFKNRSDRVLYEVLNEPHGISDAVWNDIQGRAIQAIRAEDDFHTIVVGPVWNSYLNLAAMPAYSDTNLLYTFHFYAPHLFTHQGTTWGNPVPADLVGVPFPYDASLMPALPASLVGTWWQDMYNAYPQQGNEAWVKSQLDIAVQFRSERNVPLWCGEFGTYPPPSSSKDRAVWAGIVRSYLEEKGIAWTFMTDGIFEKYTVGCIETDVDTMITSALGLTPPVQREPASEPDASGFTFYDDFIAHGLIESGWFSSGEYDLYSKESPHEGESCLKINGFEQYGDISFRFCPYRDLSVLVNQGFVLDLWTRCDSPGTRIDLIFKDTKTTDPQDHPWRINATLDSSVVKWDGEWHHVRIPLKNFVETGSWDNNQWYNQQGLFDWKVADRFTIAAGYHSLDGIDIFFDDIRISAPQINVTFRIAAPPETPSEDTVYLMGSMNFWDPGPGGLGTDGSNHDQPMRNIGPNLWERTLSSEAGTVLEYKYTRGVWDKVEKGPQGQEIPNRSLTVPASGVIQLDTVRKWSDISEPAVTDNAGYSLPLQYSLHHNYPNPFNPSTVIRYTLPHGTDVELTVFNTQGQRIAVLVQGYRDGGEHEVRFECSTLAAGVYFYRLKTGDFEEIKKLVFLR